MFMVLIQQGVDSITFRFYELCDALKLIETATEVCDGAKVTIQKVEV